MTSTTSMSPPTLERCAAAIVGVRERYKLGIASADGPNRADEVWGVVDKSDDTAVHFGTRAECQAWIDLQAARACIGALMPVSDGMLQAMFIASPGLKAVFTAALTAVLRGEA